MKEIKLTQNKVVMVDDEDFEWLNQWKWHVQKDKNRWYAVRNDKMANVRMHRLILDLKSFKYDKRIIDHKDNNGLNNQRHNLRICNNSQNQMNRNLTSSSGYKGVSWHKLNNKWTAQVRFNKKNYHLGYFNDKREAALAYDKKATELFGEFAKTNFKFN